VTVHLIRERRPKRTDRKTIAAKIQRLLDHLGRGEAEISILLTDDVGIAGYNERFLGRSGPTNVISFGAGDPLPSGPDILGDIAINVDAAARQSKIRGVSVTDEVVILAVHGLAHLLGFTHDPVEGAAEADASAMEAEEKRLLSLVDIAVD
jgi:probable rRNA maturation factor